MMSRRSNAAKLHTSAVLHRSAVIKSQQRCATVSNDKGGCKDHCTRLGSVLAVHAPKQQPNRFGGHLGNVIMTHAHFDHMGSIAEFPKAQIHIQKSELLTCYEAITLPKRFSHLTAIIDPENLRACLEASIEHRVTLIDGDKDNVLPGLHVRIASGHTIGQQFVILETGQGRRVIPGDCLYNKCQLHGHNNDGVYVPLNNATGSVWEQIKSLDKLNDEIGGDLKNLVILHDPDRWKDLPVEKEVEGWKIVRAATA